MRRIKHEELPSILTNDLLYKLAEMAEEIPVSNEWIEISKRLTDEQKVLVYKKRFEVHSDREKARQASLSPEEKAAEAAKWERIMNDPDPHKFYGNMGQPETPQEYKNRYGVWPPGYDQETGERLPDNPK